MSAKTPYKEEGQGSNSLEWDYITFVNGGKDEKETEGLRHYYRSPR